METSKSYEILIPYLKKMDVRLQAIATQIIGGEKTTRRELAKRVDKSPTWIGSYAIPKIRQALTGVAVIESSKKRNCAGYRLRLLAEDERRKVGENNNRQLELNLSGGGDSARDKPPRLPLWFIPPWTGGFDLRFVVAVSVDEGRLTLQLNKGGYYRGPRHPESERVAAAVMDAVSKLDGARCMVYGVDSGEGSP